MTKNPWRSFPETRIPGRISRAEEGLHNSWDLNLQPAAHKMSSLSPERSSLCVQAPGGFFQKAPTPSKLSRTKRKARTTQEILNLQLPVVAASNLSLQSQHHPMNKLPLEDPSRNTTVHKQSNPEESYKRITPNSISRTKCKLANHH